MTKVKAKDQKKPAGKKIVKKISGKSPAETKKDNSKKGTVKKKTVKKIPAKKKVAKSQEKT